MNCGCLDCANSEFLSTRPESKFRCLMLQRPDFCSEERHGNAKRTSISPPVKGGKAPEKEGRAFLSASGISFQADQAWTAKDGSSTSPGESRRTGLETRQTTSKSNTLCPSLQYIWGPGTREGPSSQCAFQIHEFCTGTRPACGAFGWRLTTRGLSEPQVKKALASQPTFRHPVGAMIDLTP